MPSLRRINELESNPSEDTPANNAIGRSSPTVAVAKEKNCGAAQESSSAQESSEKEERRPDAVSRAYVEHNEVPVVRLSIMHGAVDNEKNLDQEVEEATEAIESSSPLIPAARSNSTVAPNSSLEENINAPIDNLHRTPSPNRGSSHEGIVTATEVKKSKCYRGVNIVKRTKIPTYAALKRISGKSCYLGTYRLEVDAAFAHDLTVRYLTSHVLYNACNKVGSRWRKKNFKTIEDYQIARSKEVQERALSDSDVGGLDSYSMKNKVEGLIDAFLKKNESTSSKGIGEDDLKSRKRKSTNMAEGKRKRIRSSVTLSELRAKTDVLTKKWGLLFCDQDWQQQEYMQMHQRNIAAKLADLTKLVDSTLLAEEGTNNDADMFDSGDNICYGDKEKDSSNIVPDFENDSDGEVNVNVEVDDDNSLTNSSGKKQDERAPESAQSTSSKESVCEGGLAPRLMHADTDEKSDDEGSVKSSRSEKVDAALENSDQLSRDTNKNIISSPNLENTADNDKNMNMQTDDMSMSESSLSVSAKKSAYDDVGNRPQISHAEASERVDDETHRKMNNVDSALDCDSIQVSNFTDKVNRNLTDINAADELRVSNERATAERSEKDLVEPSPSTSEDITDKRSTERAGPSNDHPPSAVALDAASVTPLQDIQNPNPTSAHANIDSAELLALTEEQANSTQFPIGCKIWSNFQPSNAGESFKCGKVLGASFQLTMRRLFFEVLFEDGSGSWLNEAELAYAPDSSVQYSPSSFSDSGDDVSGQILMCRTKQGSFCYSIMISTNESDEHKVIDDVEPGEVKWRNSSE